MVIRILFVVTVLLMIAVNAQINCVGGNCGVNSMVCPTGFQMSGNACIESSTTTCASGSCHVCPEGFYHHQGQCQRYSCPNNYVFNNGYCQVPNHNCYQSCQTGYVLISGLCHLQSPQPCVQPQCTVTGGCQQQCLGPQCCQQPPVVVYPNISCPTPAPTIPPPVTVTPTHIIPTTSPVIIPTTCPPGTVYINGECRVIRCPDGLIYHEGRCISLSCPKNTSWDGQRCQVINQVSTNTSIDIKQSINNYNNISNPTNVNLNNENTVYVYTADERVVKINGSAPTPTSPPIILTTPFPHTPTSQQTPQKCCTVVTPRICSHITNKWVCYNRRYARCGSFCAYPKIYLKPPRSIQRQANIVVPPQFPRNSFCSGDNCGYSHADCSGCATGGSCTPYCHEYSCGGQCEFYDQRQYCQEYPGQPGCHETDGCFEDWCS